MAGGEKHDEGGGPGLWQLGGRILLLGLLVVAGLFLAQQWGAGDRRERESFALVSGNIRLSDLQDPVEILRDSRGIPHVFAERELEGFFGLGFVHAQDRLAQMAWIRRKAHGRSAEILGESALASDRLARLLEIASASERAAKALPAETQAVLEAYSAGVNARIARVREGLMSPPHRLMGGLEGLTSWKPADTVAVVKLLSWCMGGTLETTLVLDDLIQRLDSVPARPFFPGGASVDFGVAPDVPRHAMPETERSRAIREELLGTTRALCRGIGLPSGGAFVLDGSKTGSGAPMIVADWHFEPAVPGLLHESQLFAGETQVAGVTVPGTPLYWGGAKSELCLGRRARECTRLGPVRRDAP